jgi:molybdopterin converting factor small subunit
MLEASHDFSSSRLVNCDIADCNKKGVCRFEKAFSRLYIGLKMPRIHIPASLRAYTHDRRELDIEGNSVREIMKVLRDQYPDLVAQLMQDADQLHPFINLYIEGKNIRELQLWDTPIHSNQDLLIVPALAGG